MLIHEELQNFHANDNPQDGGASDESLDLNRTRYINDYSQKKRKKIKASLNAGIKDSILGFQERNNDIKIRP
jgi:hypothetical protein